MRKATMFAAALTFASALSAAEVLFPQPLHLVRRIDDPVSQSTVTLHEYAAGNQLITVNGSRVAIADYDKQQITEIDRAAGTYSVTRFDEVATSRARVQPAPKRAAISGESVPKKKWTVSALSGRSRETFELKADETQKIEVSVDRRVSLSRAALEVLIGAAFPNQRGEAHDAILGVAAEQSGAAQERFGLPMEQDVIWEAAGEKVVVRSSVVDVTNDLPPADLLTIPPGAQRVDSRTTRLLRELENLDRIPGGGKP
ncbi:MAG: hypothetical protein ACJ74H_08695 [Thermoanaerobaculia bacterium]